MKNNIKFRNLEQGKKYFCDVNEREYWLKNDGVLWERYYCRHENKSDNWEICTESEETLGSQLYEEVMSYTELQKLIKPNNDYVLKIKNKGVVEFVLLVGLTETNMVVKRAGDNWQEEDNLPYEEFLDVIGVDKGILL